MRNAFINLRYGDVAYSPCIDDRFALSGNTEFLNHYAYYKALNGHDKGIWISRFWQRKLGIYLEYIALYLCFY